MKETTEKKQETQKRIKKLEAHQLKAIKGGTSDRRGGSTTVRSTSGDRTGR